MTGININNHAGNVANLQDPAVLNAPQPNLNPNPPVNAGNDLISQFEVFEKNNNLFVNTDEEPLLSASMRRKFESVDQAVQKASAGEQDMSMDDMLTMLAGYSEKSLDPDDAGKRVIFQGAREARALDHKAVEFTMKLLDGLLFSKLPGNEEAQNLKNETQQLLMRLMKGKYRPEGRAVLSARLPELVSRLKTAADAIGDEGAKQKAKLLADDVAAAFNRILKNRSQAAQFMRANRNNDNKITFGSLRDVIGMGPLLSTVKEQISSFFAMPKVTEDKVLEKISLGQSSLESEAAAHPEFGTIFKEYSAKCLEKLSSDLAQVASKVDDSKIQADLAVPLDPATDAGSRKADEVYGLLLPQIRDLNLLARDADNTLNASDRTTLFSAESLENRIGSRLELLKLVYSGRPDCIEVLDKLAANRDTMTSVLETVGYSPSLFRALVENPSIIDSLVALKTAASDDDVRQAVTNVCTVFALQIPFADNTLPAALLQGVPTGDLSQSAAIVLQHLPARYELTSDALACINYVLNGNTQITKSTMDITLDDLKTAYRSVCNPSRELKNVLKDAGLANELQNVENILLKAAYHQYLSDNAGNDARTRPFAENPDFKNFMGITADGANNTVNESRYSGFDPTVVNTQNTNVGTFLKAFNIMMNHSGFLDACEKIPEVHLEKRLSEALGANLDGLVESLDLQTNKPELAQSFRNATTSKAKVEWFKNNQAALAALFISKNNTNLQDIERSNVAEISRQQKVIADLGLNGLLNYSRTVETSKIGTTGNSSAGAANVDDLFRGLDKVKGSESLAYLVSTISHLTATSAQDVLKGNRTFLGLKGEDFLNPAKLGDIRNALANADPSVRESLDYKLCFQDYAKLRLLANRAGPVAEQDLRVIHLSMDQIHAAVNALKNPNPAPQPQDDLLNTFVIMEKEVDNNDTRLVNFCYHSGALTDLERIRILENLVLDPAMFKAKDNIFVSDDESGKKQMEAIKSALKDAVSALKTRNPNTAAIMSRLSQKIDEQLAGHRTRSLANTLVAVSPYLHPEETAQDNVAKTIEIKYNAMFRKGDKTFRSGLAKIASNFLGVAREPSQTMSDLLSGMQTRKHDADVMVDTLLRNRFCSVVMENALRNVAYSNGFSTLADFKYAMTSDKVDAKGKSRSDLIREVAAVAARSLGGVDQGTIMKLALKITESDDYMNHLSQGITKGFTRSVRRFGRILGRTQVASFGRSVRRFFSSLFTSRAARESKLRVCSLTAENTLLSIKPGASLVYTKDSHLTVGAGVNVAISEKLGKVGFSGEVKISANSNLEIERTEDGKFVFLLAAGLAGKLGLNAGIKDKISVGSLGVEAEAGMQRGYAVTFADKDQAVAFLSKVMVAGVEVTDFQKALEIRKDAMKNLGASISLEINPASVVSVIKDVQDDSDYDTVQSSINLGLSLSGEWNHQRGSNSHTFTKTVSKEFSFEASASLNVQQHLLGNVNPEDLSDEEKKDYDKKMSEIKSVDKMIHLLTDKKAALKEFVTNKKIVERFSSHEYTQDEKIEWKAMDDFEKYSSDPDRYLAETLVNSGLDSLGKPIFKDVETFQQYLVTHTPGLKNAVALKERVDKLLVRMLGVINRLNTEHLRFSADLKLGKDSEEVASFSFGVKYGSETTTTFDTNLMQTDLRSVERTVKITPDSSASPEQVSRNNVKFLTSAMKESGFSNEQISKAVTQLQQITLKGEKLTGFEIVKTASKETLANFKKTLTSHREAPSKIGKFVDKLPDSSLEPTRVVFTTEKKIDSQSFSVGGGYLVKVDVGTEEKLSSSSSYEVTF